jgi:3-phosphoshikimate 1-carboxyvinyltransferase
MTRTGLSGQISVPADKSITHRAVMFGSLAKGRSRIRTSSLGRDNLASVRIMRQLGVEVEGSLSEKVFSLAAEEGLPGFKKSPDSFCELIINGQGFEALKAPVGVLDCGNSGTTARLLTGVLAGRLFSAQVTGDDSLRKRPFKRVTDPLRQMGANFSGDCLPFTVSGGQLKGIDFVSPRASAQVKSALLLAGLQAQGRTTVTEPRQSRDHTERMFQAMGCELQAEGQENGSWQVMLPMGQQVLRPLDITVPGDFSAAAFLIVAASIIPGSHVRIVGLGFNHTRIGLYQILRRMGAKINVLNMRLVGGEEVVDLEVRSAELHGVNVTEGDVVLAIDEIPILAVACALAEGTSRISGAGDLRVKESDRLAMTAALLSSFSYVVEEQSDGLIIHGNPEVKGLNTCAKSEPPDQNAPWRLSGDHRIAMSGAVLELALCGQFCVQDLKAVETSFPEFLECFQSLSAT